MASLEYVMAGWLRLRRLIVASVGAGWGCGGLLPRPLPCQGQDRGPGAFCRAVCAWVGMVGQRPGSIRGGFIRCTWCLCGLLLRGDASDGVGTVELEGVTVWLVLGAAALVEYPLAVPGHPNLHPTVWTRVQGAVLDRALEPDPVARVVVAEGLLDCRALVDLWVRFGLGRCLWREKG